MKLADVRKLAIKQRSRIHFAIAGGLECVVTEHGIAQVPGLREVPRFNLETELAASREFRLEPVAVQERNRPSQARTLTRQEVEAMLGPVTAAASAAEHEEE